MFCFQHDGIMPDILMVGKALGGGLYPVSAALASREIMSVFTPGSHGAPSVGTSGMRDRRGVAQCSHRREVGGPGKRDGSVLREAA